MAFDIFRNILHYGCHFLVPVLFARLFWRQHWKAAAMIMIATMVMDADHLLADPVFDPFSSAAYCVGGDCVSYSAADPVMESTGSGSRLPVPFVYRRDGLLHGQSEAGHRICGGSGIKKPAGGGFLCG